MPIFAFSGSLTRQMPQYDQANGRGITSFRFDDERGSLQQVSEFTGIDDTAWLVVDPERRRLYATCEVPGADQSALATFTIDPTTGELAPGGRQSAGGGEACHASLTPDRRFLLLANYNGVVPPGAPDQALTVFPLAADGSPGPAVASIRHAGSGPNADRQTSAHAHCAVASPDGRFAYVADLGIDRIVTYELFADGRIAHRRDSGFAVPPGLGPRHIVFHPDGRMLFLVTELNPVVMSFSVDSTTGALTRLHSFEIERTDERIVQPAGIVLSADSRFLFVSLRVCNEILGLEVDPATGALTQTGRWPSGGATPRDLTLSPSGRHLLVANQDSDTLSVFRVDDTAGTISGPVQQVAVGTPMAIKLATFPPA